MQALCHFFPTKKKAPKPSYEYLSQHYWNRMDPKCGEKSGGQMIIETRPQLKNVLQSPSISLSFSLENPEERKARFLEGYLLKSIGLY